MTKPLLLIIFFAALLLHVSFTRAQEKVISKTPPVITDSIKTVTEHTAKQTDLYDLVNSFKKKSNTKTRRDSITSKPVYSYIPAVGYTLSSGFAVSFSGNIQFRRDSMTRISTITASAAVSTKKQFTVPIESNIWFSHNKWLLVGDDRFYIYPQSTFGLGSSSHLVNEDPMTFTYIRFYETLMRHITGNFYAGAGYILDYHANVSEEGKENGKPSNYFFYGEAAHTVSSGITVNTLFDGRDNSTNPSKGFYSSFQYRDNYRTLGSTRGWRSLIIDTRKYFNFPAGSNNVLALWSFDWLTVSGKPPYLDLPATSWDAYSSTGRGYIQGRFRGAQMVYAEAEYRFRLTQNGLLGGVLFVNGETLSAKPGTRLQSVQPGFGPGLRVKLNKLSKTNICIDYGFGHEGSKGLFINVGELF